MTTPYIFLTPVRTFFRKRRFANFRERLGSCRTIVDIGGEDNLWTLIGRKEGVFILNLNIRATPERDGVPYAVADGCEPPLWDQSVDLAFPSRSSNIWTTSKVNRVLPPKCCASESGILSNAVQVISD
jgi:hypothetical protein